MSYRILSLIIDQGCDHHIYVQTILDIYNIIVRENQFWISVRLSVVFFSNNFCFVSLTLQIYYDYAIAPLRLFNMIVLSIIQFVLFFRSIRWLSYPRRAWGEVNIVLRWYIFHRVMQNLSTNVLWFMILKHLFIIYTVKDIFMDFIDENYYYKVIL